MYQINLIMNQLFKINVNMLSNYVTVNLIFIVTINCVHCLLSLYKIFYNITNEIKS